MPLPQEFLEDPEPKFWRFMHTDKNPLGETTKQRIIYAPNNAMRKVHQDLIIQVRNLRSRHMSMEIAPVRQSPLRNVTQHSSGRYFLLLDFQSAYRHVDLDRLVDVFAQFSPKSDAGLIRAHLERYCFVPEGGLATGAPASPDLFNLYAAKLIDEPVWEVVKSHATAIGDAPRYSRYIDDLTLSLERQQFGRSLRDRINKIIKEAGFTLQFDDARPPMDLAKGPVLITGLRLEHGGRIIVPRHYVRELRERLRTAIVRKLFFDDYRIEKMAGMYGAFKSGLDYNRRPTELEQEVLDLWQRYRQLRKQYFDQYKTP